MEEGRTWVNECGTGGHSGCGIQQGKGANEGCNLIYVKKGRYMQICKRSEFLHFGGGVMNPLDKLKKAVQPFLRKDAYVYKCNVLYLIVGIYYFFRC